jgi:hypothetical protein
LKTKKYGTTKMRNLYPSPKNLFEIFTQDRPAQSVILYPWLLSGTMTMIYSPAGHGKSMYCFNLALQIAQGGYWLGQKCSPCKVLYIDGEMGGREWLKRIPENIMFTDELNENFQVICPDDFPDAGNVPSLGNRDNFRAWMETCQSYDLIVVDNYLTTCIPESNKDSDLDVWYAVQRLIIALRNQNKAVIMVHHASKSGVQYGTVLKEVIVNNVMRIRQFPVQYLHSGLVIEMKVQKDRGYVFEGQNEMLIEIIFSRDGVLTKFGDLDRARTDYLIDRKQYGVTNLEMAEDLGIKVGKVKELLFKAKKETNEINEIEKDELWNV